MAKLVVSLDDLLHNAFKQWCKRNGITMTEAVIRFIQFSVKDAELKEEMRKAKLRDILGAEADTFEKLREYTLAEIREILDRNEAEFLIYLLNGIVYVPDLPPKYALLSEVQEGSEIFNLTEKYGVKLVDLKQKLLNLTNFQAYVLMHEIAEFWEREQIENLDELLDRISRE